jgi:pyridoxine 4-dehydrogenase
MSTFPLGRWRVRRSGYGAMQLDGPFASGGPADPATATGVLQAAVAAGVDHIDRAQYYGAVNDLHWRSLCPYPDKLAIVSKVAVRGDAVGAGLQSGESRQLRAGIVDNLRALRVGLRVREALASPGRRRR